MYDDEFDVHFRAGTTCVTILSYQTISNKSPRRIPQRIRRAQIARYSFLAREPALGSPHVLLPATLRAFLIASRLAWVIEIIPYFPLGGDILARVIELEPL